MGIPLAPLALLAGLSVLPFLCPASCFCCFAGVLFGLFAWLLLGVAFARILLPFRLRLNSGLIIAVFFFLALSALLDFSLGLGLDKTCVGLFLLLGVADLSEGLSVDFLAGELGLDTDLRPLVLVGIRERELLRLPLRGLSLRSCFGVDLPCLAAGLSDILRPSMPFGGKPLGLVETDFLRLGEILV